MTPAVVAKVDDLVVRGETAVEKLVSVATPLDLWEGGALGEVPQSLLTHELDDLRTDLITELLDWFGFEDALLQQLTVFLRLGDLLVAQLKEPRLEDVEAGERGGAGLEDDANLLRDDCHHLLQVVDGCTHLSPRLVEELDRDAVHVLQRVVGPHETRNELITNLRRGFPHVEQLTEDFGEHYAGMGKRALVVRVPKEQLREHVMLCLGEVPHALECQYSGRGLPQLRPRVPAEEPKLLPQRLGDFGGAGDFFGERSCGEHA